MIDNDNVDDVDDCDGCDHENPSPVLPLEGERKAVFWSVNLCDHFYHWWSSLIILIIKNKDMTFSPQRVSHSGRPDRRPVGGEIHEKRTQI